MKSPQDINLTDSKHIDTRIWMFLNLAWGAKNKRGKIDGALKFTYIIGIKFSGGWKKNFKKIWYFKYRGLTLIYAKKIGNIILTINKINQGRK